MASVYLLGPWMSPIQASDDPHDAYMFFYAVHGVAGAIICVAAVFAMKLLGVPFGRLERWRKNRVTMRRISAPAYPTTETTDRADRRDSVDI
ncbi:hypothetical protein ASF65_08270 [Aureimonas sp. Leaf324]|jgi:uncharacterized membrane protein YedE/YeeE|nr:hypothetical protein ASF65_08270 [Aureimonas sp. Leaf324]